MKRVCVVITIGIALLLVRLPLSHGRTAARFLTLESSSRAHAMGNAFATMSGDITCLFSNPSGLSDMEELQGAYSYTDRWDAYHRLAVGGPVNLGLLNRPLGVVGGGFQRLDDSWAFTASYANRYIHQLSKKRSMGISIGVSGKIIHEEWAYVGANAYALDLGLLYDVLNIYINESTTKLNEPTFRFRIGAVLQNLGPKMEFGKYSPLLGKYLESYPLPRRLRIGALAGFNLRARDLFPAEQSIPMNISILRLNIAGEFTKLHPKVRTELLVEGSEEYLNQKYVGMEMWMLDILAVRLGYKSASYRSDYYSDEGITYGLGLRLPLASMIAFAMPQSSEPNLIDKLYRHTDRQMFLQLDFARTPDEDLKTFGLSGGF